MATDKNIEEVDTEVETAEEVVAVEKPKATKPRAPKKPQDHKPKKAPATAKDEALPEGKMEITVKDIDLVVDSDALEDFELMEHIMAVDMGDQRSIIHAGQGLRMILGLEQHEMVMNKLRDEKTGRAPIGDVLQFFIELIQAFYPNS